MKQEIGKYEGLKAHRYYKVVRGDAEEEYGIDANVFKYLKSILPSDLSNKTVLDLGCGDGRWSEYLSGLGAAKVLGVDISQEMVSLALDRIKERSLDNIEIIKADIQNLPIAKFSFDIVVSTFSLMYFRNLEEVLSEISRVLRNGGIVYIATNIVQINDDKLREKLKGTFIPVILGTNDQEIVVENLIQSIEQYHEAFSNANLRIETETYFEPEGVSIPDDFRYKRGIVLKKAVFKLSTSEPIR